MWPTGTKFRPDSSVTRAGLATAWYSVRVFRNIYRDSNLFGRSRYFDDVVR